MRKQASRVIGMALMVAGLMALTASAAQAANLNLIDEPGSTGEPGFFLSGGVERPTGLTHETVNGSLVTSTTAALLIPAKAAEITCGGLEVSEAFIENEYEDFIAGAMKKGGHGHATLLFSSCKVNKINATTGALEGELTKCTEELNKETSLGSPLNHHVTAKTLVLVRRHEGVTYLLFEPLINSKATAEEAKALTLPFSTVKFGGTCALPEKVNITGGVAVKAPAADENKPLLNVETFSTAGKETQALLGAKLKFGANEAFIKGEARIELTGTGSKLSWGAM